MLFPRGDIERCLRQHGRSLALAREAGSVETETAALGGLGDAEYLRGRLISAHRHYQRCVELSRQHGLFLVEVANRPMGHRALARRRHAGRATGCPGGGLRGPAASSISGPRWWRTTPSTCAAVRSGRWTWRRRC
ncbi:MAG: tetratricopeptide repeat protein [Alphaproteobacteria bacterium]|nr:tetratricopeptide repeat protein [Alphaproteobacteria bacterium]